jgi:hypothetical protein
MAAESTAPTSWPCGWRLLSERGLVVFHPLGHEAEPATIDPYSSAQKGSIPSIASFFFLT